MPGTRKLGRASDHRKAMLRAMVTYLLENGKIETTLARAKEVRNMTEKMITLGKRDDLHAKRQVFSFITKENVAKKVIDELGPKYTDRDGGYTRIVKNRCAPRRCCRNGHHRAGVSCQPQISTESPRLSARGFCAGTFFAGTQARARARRVKQSRSAAE